MMQTEKPFLITQRFHPKTGEPVYRVATGRYERNCDGKPEWGFYTIAINLPADEVLKTIDTVLASNGGLRASMKVA
jgi:hypothetical protein